MMLKTQDKIRIAITKDTRIRRCRMLIKLIELCGGTPVLIPFWLKPSDLGLKRNAEPSILRGDVREVALDKHLAKVKSLLETCHGVLIPGNRYDVPPMAYGDETLHPETLKRQPASPLYVRYQTESLMIKHAFDYHWPILGICGGFQMLNVVLGGTLVQHLPDDPRVKKHKLKHVDPSLRKLGKDKQLAWEQTFASHILAGQPENIYPATHGMKVDSNSTLAEIYRDAEPYYDSFDNIHELSIHHQGCFAENLSDQLKPVAFAPDGVVEAAEMINYENLCLITQFHYECNVSGIAKKAVERLIGSASLSTYPINRPVPQKYVSFQLP